VHGPPRFPPSSRHLPTFPILIPYGYPTCIPYLVFLHLVLIASMFPSKIIAETIPAHASTEAHGSANFRRISALVMTLICNPEPGKYKNVNYSRSEGLAPHIIAHPHITKSTELNANIHYHFIGKTQKRQRHKGSKRLSSLSYSA
jgi:hypothetical protein